MLKLLKALWERGGQYIKILEKIRSSEEFWGNLSLSIAAKEIMSTSSENLKGDEIQLAAYRYKYLSDHLSFITTIFKSLMITQGTMDVKNPDLTVSVFDVQVPMSSDCFRDHGTGNVLCKKVFMSRYEANQ